MLISVNSIILVIELRLLVTNQMRLSSGQIEFNLLLANLFVLFCNQLLINTCSPIINIFGRLSSIIVVHVAAIALLNNHCLRIGINQNVVLNLISYAVVIVYFIKSTFNSCFSSSVQLYLTALSMACRMLSSKLFLSRNSFIFVELWLGCLTVFFWQAKVSNLFVLIQYLILQLIFLTNRL